VPATYIKPNGHDTMTQLNPFTVVPNGVAALVDVENYLETCGLDLEPPNDRLAISSSG
jgi:hypothetical protein